MVTQYQSDLAKSWAFTPEGLPHFRHSQQVGRKMVEYEGIVQM